MKKIDYALYTEYIDGARDNDTADWYASRDEAIAAAREYIAAGANPDDIGIMAFEHNGDCLWGWEICFDETGACWCDDVSAWDNYDEDGNVVGSDIIRQNGHNARPCGQKGENMDWAALNNNDRAAYRDAYAEWMCDERNEFDCAHCPHADDGMDRNRADYVVGPCGQQHCWVTCHCRCIKL